MEKYLDIWSEEDEKSLVIDELIELLELQIKLKEGGILFKIARALGLPRTSPERLSARIRKRQLLRKFLQKEDIGTLRQDLEFGKHFTGEFPDINRAQTDYQQKLLRFEELMKELSDYSGKKRKN